MRYGDLTANREMMGDLRVIQLEPDMSPEVEFLFDYGSPFSYLARYPDNIFITNPMGHFVDFWILIRTNDNLHNSRTITQVNKNKRPMISAQGA